jgi:hypothetical protein
MISAQRMIDSSTKRFPDSVALRELKSDAVEQAATGRLSATAMRNALEPFGRKRNAYALMLLAIDLSLFVVGQFLAVTATSGGFNNLRGRDFVWQHLTEAPVLAEDSGGRSGACPAARNATRPSILVDVFSWPASLYSRLLRAVTRCALGSFIGPEFHVCIFAREIRNRWRCRYESRCDQGYGSDATVRRRHTSGARGCGRR